MAKPRIIYLDLDIDPLFGQLGPEVYVTGHHTAGPKDASVQDAVRLCRQYHAAHKSQGWGGIGYHVCIARDGTIIFLRPPVLKGAHVGGYNSGNYGVMMHGTTGDRPTKPQAVSYRWLMRNAHTRRVRRKFRVDRDLRQAQRRGHNDWPGHTSNACPGTHKKLYVTGTR